jgi:hypothetical protein
MDEKFEIQLSDLFNTSSAFYTQPWPEIAVKALEVMHHYAHAIVDRRGPKVVQCDASPFEFLLNLSSQPLEFDGAQYGPGELAFHLAGRKVAWLNFFDGPQSQLAVLIEGASAMSDSYRLERARMLELEIVEALKAEARRLKLRNPP